MSDWGIIRYKDEIMIKVNGDFPMEDDEEPKGIVITLKNNQAERFANDILKEVKNGR